MVTSLEIALRTVADVAEKIEDISVRASDKHSIYDADISTLKMNVSLMSSDLRDVSSDLHAFVTLNRDDQNEAHPVLTAKRYVVTDDEKQPISSFVIDNGILKISDNGTGVDPILLEDVYLDTSSHSVKKHLAELDSSLATKAFNSSVVELDSSLRTAYRQIEDVSNHVKDNSTKIDDISTVISNFWDKQNKRVSVVGIEVKDDNVSTYVRAGDNAGELKILNSINGDTLGTLYVNDVHIGKKDSSTSFFLTKKADEVNEL